MARTPRTHNPRSVRIWPGLTQDDTPGSTVTVAATTYSIPIYGPEVTGLAVFFFEVGAGLTGTFTIQGTLEPQPELTTDTDWVTLTPTEVLGAALAYAGGAGTTGVRVVDVMWEWMRIKYTHTSGTAQIGPVYSRVDNSH